MKIVLTDDAGAEHDVTTAVPVMYDALHSSLDWGSGFLDAEESRAMYRVAVAANWKLPEYPQDLCVCGHQRNFHYATIEPRRPAQPVGQPRELVPTEVRCQLFHTVRDPAYEDLSRIEFNEQVALGTTALTYVYTCECRAFVWIEGSHG